MTLTHATGVISKVMEKSCLAITSNGRTVYELAHMSIPSIVVSQHDRENTHEFARQENGFIPLGIYREDKTEKQVVKELTKLIQDSTYRRALFDRTRNYSFGSAKSKVVASLLDLLR